MKSKPITRRNFLKLSAAAGAVAVVSGCTVNLQQTEYLESYVRSPEDALPGEDTWYATTCRQCPAGCGILVRVSDGRARKIEGNPIHPLNRGRLCARGHAGLQVLYNPDRLRSPVRQAQRGSAQFEPLYWEEALQQVAEHLASPRPESIAFVGGYGTTPDHLYWLARHFLQALGGLPPLLFDLYNVVDGRTVLAQTSVDLFGVEALPVFDVAEADVVFSFGAHFLETWLSPVAYSRAYGWMRRGRAGKRGVLVHFEPRMSMTAANADEWVPIRPGSEGWVALALGKIIVEENLGPADLARRYAHLYEKVDLAEAAHVSDVPVEKLRTLARAFADAHHQVAIPGGTMAGHTNAPQAIAAVHALNLVMGQVGQAGGAFLAPSPPFADFAPSPVASFTQMQDLVERMAAGQIKVLFIHGSNPVLELPAAVRFAEALEQVPLVVSFSSFVDETALLADLILPDHTYLEGWGYQVVAPAMDRPVVSAQQPVVRPLYDTRATADVLLALAQQLGGEVAQALPWPNEVAFLKEKVAELRGLGVSAEGFWTAWRQRGGWWPEGEAREVPEPSAAWNQPLEGVLPDFSGGSEEALYLLPYLSTALSDGRGANQPWLQEMPDPMTTAAWNTWVEINPETAAELGVGDDDIVRVISPYGEIEAIVYLYPAIRPDTVAIPIGQGHLQYGRYAAGRGSNPVDLLAPRVEVRSGGLAWAATRVTIIPTGRRRRLARLESNIGVEYAREVGPPG